jgi:AcrR family transcriptional regulator
MATNTLTPRRTQTREKLMDAATSLFAQKGVLAASVEEICERAEFTRGAFYSNFADKDELCLAVLNRQAARELLATQKAVATLSGAVLEANTIDGLLELALSVFLAAQPRSSEDLLAAMELRLHAIRNPGLRASLLALNEEMVEQIGTQLVTAIGRVGATLTVPVAQAIDLLHAVYTHSGSTALLNGLEPDDQSRRAQLTALLKSLVIESGTRR